LEFLKRKELGSVAEICAAASELAISGVEKIIISLGSKGAIMVSDAKTYFGHAPNISVKSTVAAGDAMVAVCALGVATSLPDKDMFAMAIAAGSASANTGGLFDKSQVMELKNKVEINQLFPSISTTSYPK
jgi:fructose-1-phosphate kinase PfkB-like protein